MSEAGSTRATWRSLVPVPADAPAAKFDHPKRGEPLRIFTYRNVDGAELGHVCLFKRSAGEEIMLTLTFCEAKTGVRAWRWLQFPKLRPLYGLEALADDPDIAPHGGRPLLVFDEASAEAARSLLPEFAPISWPGGARWIDQVDFSPLRGKRVAIWPPSGPKGHAAALKIVDKLKGYGGGAWALIEAKPDEVPENGWNCELADAVRLGWNNERLRAWYHAHLTGWAEIVAAGDAGPPHADAPPIDPEDDRPEIRWIAGELPAAVDAAEQALIDRGEKIYQRSGMLVRVVHRDAPTVRNYQRKAGTLGIVMVDAPYLTHRFTRLARWVRWNERAKEWLAINAPEQVAITFISLAGHWRLPRLRACISAPTLRPDGSILQRPGYDDATQTWFDPGAVKFPKVPDKPSRAEADDALELLAKAIKTFPFEDDVDRSVALSLALTGLVRRSLPAAPLGAITAPVMAAGKTLLADCIAILATGASAPAMKYADSDEEAAKTALAVLMEGDAVVLIDNIERTLQGDWLCSILTSESYRQRVLGHTEMLTVPTSTLFMATGNQLVIAGDLRTRALLCRIDPKIEHPEERKFKQDLREWFMAHRPALVTAGLTAMRAYMISGEHAVTATGQPVKPFGRFEHWSHMVRETLVWLGWEDPCASVRALEADDPERGEHLRFMHAWVEEFGDEKKTAREVLEWAIQSTLGRGGTPCALEIALREVARDRGGVLSARVLAKWLQRHAGRRIQGKFFAKAGELNHSIVWRVEVVGAAKTTG